MHFLILIIGVTGNPPLIFLFLHAFSRVMHIQALTGCIKNRNHTKFGIFFVTESKYMYIVIKFLLFCNLYISNKLVSDVVYQTCIVRNFLI